MNKRSILIALIIFTILSCNSDDDENSLKCDFQTTISMDRFENAPTDALVITSLQIENDCLRINFSASGCDGSTWMLDLIDSEDILESNPVQRMLRLSLKNDELCEAVISKDVTFDITNLRVDENQVQLNIINGNNSILYEY